MTHNTTLFVLQSLILSIAVEATATTTIRILSGVSISGTYYYD